jgi:hypothetical protein
MSDITIHFNVCLDVDYVATDLVLDQLKDIKKTLDSYGIAFGETWIDEAGKVCHEHGELDPLKSRRSQVDRFRLIT